MRCSAVPGRDIRRRWDWIWIRLVEGPGQFGRGQNTTKQPCRAMCADSAMPTLQPALRATCIFLQSFSNEWCLQYAFVYQPPAMYACNPCIICILFCNPSAMRACNLHSLAQCAHAICIHLSFYNLRLQYMHAISTLLIYICS